MSKSAGHHCPKCKVPLKKGTMVTAQDKNVTLIKLDGTVKRSVNTMWMCDRCWRKHDAALRNT